MSGSNNRIWFLPRIVEMVDGWTLTMADTDENQEEYFRYPDSFFVRHLKYKIIKRGFRTREIVLETTLIDADIYTVEKLADFYYRR